MPFAELRGFAKEVFLDKKAEQLAAIYGRARTSLQKKLRTDLTDFQRMRAEALLVQVNQEISSLNAEVRRWSKEAMPAAYGYGLDITEERLARLGVTPKVRFDAQIHRSAINVLVDEISVDMLAANVSIKTNITRYLRLTQQRVLEDRQISRMIAEGLIQGETRRTVSDALLREFRKRLDEGQLITINGRNYDPKSYSRLVARTRFTEASNRANINASLQYGVDLVQVSVHSVADDRDELCLSMQGKIFSISGTDPDFPPLQETPPFHPNCRHQLLPITRESLEDRGLLESSASFSRSGGAKTPKTFKEFERVLNA